mmetsp:Transcript_2882/g.4646  ORF Transcript_2882/g.4646 Transcript_2882/m.4646 type:complete len:166 (-) Transcript_2882:376-873(-)
MMDMLACEIDHCCPEEAVERRKEIKAMRASITKLKHELEEMRKSRDVSKESGEYAIDHILSSNGVDRNVYFGRTLIGPHIQILLAKRKKIMTELEEEFLQVRQRTLEKNPAANCASSSTTIQSSQFFDVPGLSIPKKRLLKYKMGSINSKSCGRHNVIGKQKKHQ